jgi:cephalosporin-C deacetylase-like acetyl esterase
MDTTNDLAWLVRLAEEIGSDGAVPCDADIMDVLDYLDLHHSAHVSAIVRSGLTDAACFYLQSDDFEYDPRGAFDKYVDEGSYSADVADYWQREFARRGRSELETMIERVKAAL